MAPLVLGACVLLVAAGLGRSLLGLTAFTSTDILYGLPPWSAHGDGSAPANAFVGDPVDAVYPAMREIADRLWAGDLPAWTSQQAGGTELGATASVAILSPLSWPYLVLPLWLAPAWVKLLEIAAAIAGCFLFGRRLGLDRAPALLGGLAFATSGFLVAWTNWPQTRTAAVIPVLFWAVERLVQERTGRSVALLGLAVAGLVLGGFPSVTAYALYTAGAYAVVRVVAVELRTGRGRVGIRGVAGGVAGGLALAAVGVAVGVALTAVQLLPFLHQLGQVDLGSREQTSDDALSALSLLTAMAPDSLGTPVSRSTWLGPRNPIESFSYVGAAVLLLAGIGALGRRGGTTSAADDLHRAGADGARGVPAFLGLAVAVWGVAVYAGGPVLAAVQQLPGMDINAIGRARSVLGFLVATLAALGFQRVVRAAPADAPARSSRWPARAGWLLLGGAVGWLVLAGWRYAADEGFSDAYGQAIAVAAALTVLAVLAVLLAVRGAGRARALGLVLLPTLVVGQAAVAVQPWWPESPRESVYPTTATHDFLAAELGHDRYVSTDDAMLPGTSLAYGLRSLDGHAFLRSEFRDLLRSVDSDGFVAPTLWHPHLAALRDPTAGVILDRLGVRFVVAPPDAGPAAEGLRLVHAGETTIYERLTALPRIRWAGTAEHAPLGEAVARLGGADAADVVLEAEGSESEGSGSGLGSESSGSTGSGSEGSGSEGSGSEGSGSEGSGSGRAAVGAVGSTATVEVMEDSGDTVRAQVTADGAGHLVLADSVGDTFVATVDGVHTTLRTADHGYVAVAVPAGRHVVEIAYRSPGGRLGVAVSAGAVVLVAGLLVAPSRLSAPARTPGRRGRAAPGAGR